MEHAQDFIVQRLGDCAVLSPMSGLRFAGDGDYILFDSDLDTIRCYLDSGKEPRHQLIMLTPQVISSINEMGGTILGSSPQLGSRP